MNFVIYQIEAINEKKYLIRIILIKGGGLFIVWNLRTPDFFTLKTQNVIREGTQ